MKKKTIRILSLLAVLAFAVSFATTAFAATVSTSTKYLVSGNDVTKVQVDTSISGGTASSDVAYIVVGDSDPTTAPTSSNVLYMNQYKLDANGAATISYKMDVSALALANYETSVRFGSTAGDALSDDFDLETYRVLSAGNGYFTVLPTEGYEIDTVEIDGTAVNTLALTYQASNDVKVTTTAIAGATLGNDKIAAAKKTVANDTVNWLLEPCANSGITEIGVCYGSLLFPSMASSIGITNVKLDFSGVDFSATNGLTFAGESDKVFPYYKIGTTLYFYNGTAFVQE